LNLTSKKILYHNYRFFGQKISRQIPEGSEAKLALLNQLSGSVVFSPLKTKIAQSYVIHHGGYSKTIPLANTKANVFFFNYTTKPEIKIFNTTIETQYVATFQRSDHEMKIYATPVMLLDHHSSLFVLMITPEN
jgi:hypothetical protein